LFTKSCFSGLFSRFIKAKFLTAWLAMALVSVQAAGEVSESVEKTILDKLNSARSDLGYQVIGDAPVAGFYEVQVENGPILYVSGDGNYFFDGSLYQVRPGQFINIRDMQLNEERRQVFATRSTEDMIVFKPEGQTKAIMNVFTDVDCGYCRKLHQEVPQLNAMGIEVRYLAYPRAGIPSASYDKIATAWCADNATDTLTRTKNGERVPTAVCSDNPVAEHFRLGRQMGVTGTPAIILMDGTLIPGYQPAEDFAKILGLSTPGI
jgi:thiol:disulfide interchange protein DsbC